MTRAHVEVRVERAGGQLVVRWTDGCSAGAARFDHVPDTRPTWIGSAEELLEGADRRQGGAVLDALSARAEADGLDLGVWHADGTVELLVP